MSPMGTLQPAATVRIVPKAEGEIDAEGRHRSACCRPRSAAAFPVTGIRRSLAEAKMR